GRPTPTRSAPPQAMTWPTPSSAPRWPARGGSVWRDRAPGPCPADPPQGFLSLARRRRGPGATPAQGLASVVSGPREFRSDSHSPAQFPHPVPPDSLTRSWTVRRGTPRRWLMHPIDRTILAFCQDDFRPLNPLRQTIPGGSLYRHVKRLVDLGWLRKERGL